jgi:hypothetical protein
LLDAGRDKKPALKQKYLGKMAPAGSRGPFSGFLGRNLPDTIFQTILEQRLPKSDYLATP